MKNVLQAMILSGVILLFACSNETPSETDSGTQHAEPPREDTAPPIQETETVEPNAPPTQPPPLLDAFGEPLSPEQMKRLELIGDGSEPPVFDQSGLPVLQSSDDNSTTNKLPQIPRSK